MHCIIKLLSRLYFIFNDNWLYNCFIFEWDFFPINCVSCIILWWGPVVGWAICLLERWLYPNSENVKSWLCLCYIITYRLRLLPTCTNIWNCDIFRIFEMPLYEAYVSACSRLLEFVLSQENLTFPLLHPIYLSNSFKEIGPCGLTTSDPTIGLCVLEIHPFNPKLNYLDLQYF